MLLLPTRLLLGLIAKNRPSTKPVWSLGLRKTGFGLVTKLVTVYSPSTRIPAGPRLQLVTEPFCGS